MSPFGSTTNKDKATLEDVKGNVTEFMYHHENLVRRVKTAFNKVCGTKCETVKDIEDTAEVYADAIPGMLKGYLQGVEEGLLKIHRDEVDKWKMYAIYLSFGSCIVGLVIAHVIDKL